MKEKTYMLFFQHRGKTVSFAKFILDQRIAVPIFWNGWNNFLHKSSMHLFSFTVYIEIKQLMSNAVKFVLRDIGKRNDRGIQKPELNYIKSSESSQLFSSNGA